MCLCVCADVFSLYQYAKLYFCVGIKTTQNKNKTNKKKLYVCMYAYVSIVISFSWVVLPVFHATLFFNRSKCWLLFNMRLATKKTQINTIDSLYLIHLKDTKHNMSTNEFFLFENKTHNKREWIAVTIYSYCLCVVVGF